MNNAELDEFITRIEDSLGPNPTKEQTVEATRAAMLALTKEEFDSINLDELYRRQAV